MNRTLTVRRFVRPLTLAASLLGIAAVGAALPAEARGIPMPHDIIRAHMRHVDQVMRHTAPMVRVAPARPYPYHAYYPRYAVHPAYRYPYRYPVVVGAYPYGYYGAYVGVPTVGFSVGVAPGAPCVNPNAAPQPYGDPRAYGDDSEYRAEPPYNDDDRSYGDDDRPYDDNGPGDDGYDR